MAKLVESWHVVYTLNWLCPHCNEWNSHTALISEPGYGLDVPCEHCKKSSILADR